MNNVIDLFTKKIIQVGPNKLHDYAPFDSLLKRFDLRENFKFHKGLKKEGTKLIVTSYRGNIHYRANNIKRVSRLPIPEPTEAHLNIANNLKGVNIVYFKLTSYTDSCPHMDRKYRVTLNCLKKLVESSYQGKVVIETMSDLIAHDQYIEQLKQLDSEVRFPKTEQFIEKHGDNETLYKKRYPGAPSIKRIKRARLKLNIELNNKIITMAK